MHTRQLADDLSVTEQLAPTDLAELAARGFRSVINNRPDGEAAEQPASATLAAAAQAAGLAYRYIPVVPGQLHDAQVEAFAAALNQLPGPTLAFCRTGTRSSSLWAIHTARTVPVEAVLQTVAAAGYDLSALRPRLERSGNH